MAKEQKVTKLSTKFKSVKKVTGIPFLKIEPGNTVYVRFESNITVGMMKKKPAEFASVTNMETGELNKMLLGKVLSRTLLENYPQDSFIGKTFAITKGADKVEGSENAYFEYELEEVEIA